MPDRACPELDPEFKDKLVAPEVFGARQEICKTKRVYLMAFQKLKSILW
jgi:hypothetical protein